MKTNPLLEAALFYAGHGLRVFPLARKGKEPAIPKSAGGRGHLDATTDVTVIKNWWLEYPSANIGYSPDDETLIIDVDVRDGKQGKEQLEQLEQQHGYLPDTRLCESGSGGLQFYFRVPPGFRYAQRLAQHIDLKGSRGYVLLPPSVHPSGRPYEWRSVGAGAGLTVPVADLPAAWLALAEKADKAAADEPEAAADDPQQEFPRALLPPILDGCAWMRHCQADAKKLTEPEWYGMLSVVARCEDGRKAAHELSRPYSGYDANETNAKFDHAATAAGPITCQRVATELGGADDWCGSCAHWQKITSPVVLGQRAAEQWRKNLLLNKHKKPYANLYNASVALLQHPAAKGKLAFDEFREKCFLRSAVEDIPAGDLDERRILSLQRFLQRQMAPMLTENVARSAIELIARGAVAHPLREWLINLRWDGQPRVTENFWPRYFGAKQVALHASREDQELYWNDIAVVFLVALVARVLRPAAAVDYLLVLEGQRGSHKAKALEILAGPQYFTNQLPPRLDWQAAAEQIRGMWIVQLADLGPLLQSEAARQFIARRSDQYRPAHAKSGKITVDRQCVFAATTSERRYLWDDAGTRYILPVHTGDIALHELHRDRPQLLAEAVHLYQHGGRWWPAKHLAAVYKREQVARLIEDPWEERLLSYARLTPGFTVGQALEKFEVPFHLQTRAMEQRIERIMQRYDFRSEQGDAGEIHWYSRDAVRTAGTVQ